MSFALTHTLSIGQMGEEVKKKKAQRVKMERRRFEIKVKIIFTIVKTRTPGWLEMLIYKIFHHIKKV